MPTLDELRARYGSQPAPQRRNWGWLTNPLLPELKTIKPYDLPEMQKPGWDWNKLAAFPMQAVGEMQDLTWNKLFRPMTSPVGAGITALSAATAGIPSLARPAAGLFGAFQGYQTATQLPELVEDPGIEKLGDVMLMGSLAGMGGLQALKSGPRIAAKPTVNPQAKPLPELTQLPNVAARPESNLTVGPKTIIEPVPTIPLKPRGTSAEIEPIQSQTAITVRNPQRFDPRIEAMLQDYVVGPTALPYDARMTLGKNLQAFLDKQGRVPNNQELQAITSGMKPDVPTPSEVAFNALIPERYKTVTTDTPVIPNRNVESVSVTSDPRLPAYYQPKVPRNSVVDPRLPAHYASEPKSIQTEVLVADALPKKTVARAVKTNNPEVVEASRYALTQLPPVKSTLRKIWDRLGVAGHEALKRDSPAGEEVARRLWNTTHDFRKMEGFMIKPLQRILQPLSREETVNLWDSLNGDATPTSPAVQKAFDMFRKMEQGSITTAQELKIGEYIRKDGELVHLGPIQPRQNYAPMRPTREFFQHRRTITERLLSQGMSMPEIESMFKHARENGEIKISPQFQRAGAIPPEYIRKDKGVFIEHIRDWAWKIARARNVGPMDIGGGTMFDPEGPMVARTGKEGIAPLMNQMADKKLAHDIVSRQLGREAPPPSYFAAITGAVRQWQVLAHMQNFMFSNPANNLQTMMLSDTKSFGKALWNTITDWHRQKMVADKSGVLWDITFGVLEEMLHDTTKSKVGQWANKAYGITATENFNRIVAAGTGRGMSGHLFRVLKQDPNNIKVYDFLKKLLLATDEQMVGILKQEALTERQVRRAGAQMSAISQGMTDPMAVSQALSNPYLQPLIIFKKYAFQGTKAIKDSIMNHPTRSPAQQLALLGIMSQLVGEAVGDIRAAAVGGVAGAIRNDEKDKGIVSDIATGARKGILNRGDYVGLSTKAVGAGDNWIVNRIVANALQSWTIGMIGDAAMAALEGEKGVTDFLFGPAYSDANRLASDVVKRNWTDVGRVATGSTPLPIVGPALKQGLFPTKAQQKKKIKKKPRMF